MLHAQTINHRNNSRNKPALFKSTFIGRGRGRTPIKRNIFYNEINAKLELKLFALICFKCSQNYFPKEYLKYERY